MRSRKAQVTIFIILAILIVAGVALFLMFRATIFRVKIPESMEPVYTSFLSCLEEDTLTGINILGSQAGYIALPDFESGSQYMPFSSQLDFLGNPVPYWYYVSGNNIEKEQVPSIGDMEDDLGEYIEDKIKNCVLDNYYDQGFEIFQGEAKALTTIRDREVIVNLKMDLGISKEEESIVVKNHKIKIKSHFGNLYDSAKKVYSYEQKSLFLEDYAVDILRLYAPVDGVEMSCSPLTWNAEDVFDDLQEAIEMNTLAIKLKNNDYSLAQKENEYFIVDIAVEPEVRFLNSKQWAHSFEVAPSEASILMANPVGNQPGLGVLGFCYVPYHFVYDMKYPVLVQLFSGEEFFQFPVAVVIQGNKPREALPVSASEIELPKLCEYKNTVVKVNTYDSSLTPVEADISYECFGTKCNIEDSKFPQCVNGYILARADGFEDASQLYSTTNAGSVNIILDKLYEMNIELKLDGRSYTGSAIINFISDDSSKTIVYPEKTKVKLSEGQYEVKTYIYKDSSIKLSATTHEHCIDVPKSGLGGVFGLKEEECFDVEIPEQIISNVLSGGGKENYYILESELEESSTIEIGAHSLPTPKTIEELQDNYFLFEEKNLEVVFR